MEREEERLRVEKEKKVSPEDVRTVASLLPVNTMLAVLLYLMPPML